MKSSGFEKGKPPWGGYIEDFDLDVLRYRIPPSEVEAMMPQQLLMLKVADNAIRDAEIKEGGNVGVIIAMETDKTVHQFRGRIDLTWKVNEALQNAHIDLSAPQAADLQNELKAAIRGPVQVNEFTSFIGNIMANRVSALWDFSGPSFTLSSEENSAFKALEIAWMMLAAGEVDAMVVGAIDLAGNVEDVLVRNQLMSKINTGGKSFAFDKETDGLMVGEGAGAVVLKRPEAAQKAQDRCYALIDAVSLKRGDTTADIEETCRTAFAAAGIEPSAIGYLEVSGAGGDVENEIQGLINSYRSAPTLNCAVGSVTANIGHTFAASGIASLIKTALCLYRRYLPAVPRWSEPRMSKLWENGPFHVVDESKTWYLEENSLKRFAAINGTGQDGTFAHLLLSEDTVPKKRSSSYLKEVPCYFFPVVAKERAALHGQLESLRQRIEKSSNLRQTANQQYTEVRDVAEAEYALVVLGDNRERILQEIEAMAADMPGVFARGGEWHSPAGSYFTANPLGKKGKLAFVFPGAFNSYIGMGRDTFLLYPEMYDLLSSYTTRPQLMLRDRLVHPRSIRSLSEEKLGRHQAELEENAIATFETGINAAILNTAIMRGVFGVQPDAAFGYSMGEVSMTFSLGAWESTDKMSEVLHTHPIFRERLAGPMNAAREAWGLPPASPGKEEKIWECYTVGAPASDVKKVLETERNVYLIIVNSPSEVIIAGETKACRRVVNAMDCSCVQTPMSDSIHCDIVKPDYDNIAYLHNSPIEHVPPIDFYSAANYMITEMTSEIVADNIAKIYCKTIDFPKLVNRVYRDDVRIFLELGPKGSCTKWINEILDNKEHMAVTMDRKGANDHVSILKAVAKLFSHRVPVDMSMLYAEERTIPAAKKSRPQTITLGGNSIADSILTRENKQRFAATEPAVKNPSSRAGDPRRHTEKYEDFNSQILNEIGAHRTMIGRTHSAFLEARHASLQQLRETIRLQIMTSDPSRSAETAAAVQAAPATESSGRKKPEGVVWDYDDLLEFAGGKIANVFGREYEIIDTYKYRVRLPLPPYLLVNRVTQLDAKRGEFKPSSIVTEYDVPCNAWYSVDGQVPWAIASEAGQCDLLLISYLGIDFQSKGDRYYRLTDYTMTFMDELPKEGDTLRYEIKIGSFMKSGDTLFFDFGYDCYVEDKLIYKMSGGRAGFSSDAELAQGKGVVLSRMEEETRRSIQKQHFTPLLNCDRTAFTREDLLAITRGNIAACFGAFYRQNGANPSLRFASEEIMMHDRIVSLDLRGGPWGLGEIVSEKDMAPDHWYFPCHFKDDNVLAGTLITEGCVQLLEFYMLYLGLQTQTLDARFQPIRNQPYRIRARGQIVPKDTRFSYRMEVTEIGLLPRPFARANFHIILDGKIVVDFKDLGVELVEKTPADPAYRKLRPVSATAVGQPASFEYSAPVWEPTVDVSTLAGEAAYTSEQISEFATGSLAKCFGPDYNMYEGRMAPRTPNGDLQLISRVMEVNGTRRDFKSDANLISEYDVPADAWFFTQNSCPVVPYSILMEIALQPCGFLATYMGATMIYPDLDLCFRNLSSTAELLKNMDLRGKTVVAWSKLLVVAHYAEMIVLQFDYELCCQGETFFQGTTKFGYHTPQSFKSQKGLDRGEKIPPWFEQ
ncbi:MAG: PfaB family protein, partial [Proteobacteria bacterium]|nr:PfaB family protein [Pseudomonadota bacterium]